MLRCIRRPEKNKTGQDRTKEERQNLLSRLVWYESEVTDGRRTPRQGLGLLGFDGPSEPFVVAETPQENSGCQLMTDGEASCYER